jgi:ubiquinone/menaquinone biosynthesis C-methylase UbiE
MTQKWKEDPKLYNCDRTRNGEQWSMQKALDYHSTYVDEFLNKDPLRDWESIDRCKKLWEFSITEILTKEPEPNIEKVLDCGTKDGQFPEWLLETAENVKEAVGIEISPDYVKYAQEKGRPVVYGDVCNLPEEWTEKFDVVFSHHLLGLTPDYWKGLSEMYRVTKQGGYMVTLNDVPGNPRKHYSYIEDETIFGKFVDENHANIIYNHKHPNRDFPKEWIFLIQKPIWTFAFRGEPVLKS